MLNLIQTAFAATDKATEVTTQTTSQLTALIGVIIEKIPLWITAFIVIIISFFLAKIIKSSVENKLTAEGVDEEHQGVVILAGRTANATVLTIGITAGLKIAGIDLTSIIAAGAFGIGFALKDIIMNFLAGVMLLASKHYSIGDIIKVGSIMGKIEEIQTRATIIKNFDGTKVLVPNSTLFKNSVTNYSSNPFRRVSLIVGVAYGTDLKQAMNLCIKAVKESKGILINPKPSVAITEFGESSINLKVNGWVDSSKGIKKPRTSMIINITKEFQENNITIPFPITTIYLNKQQEKNKTTDLNDTEKLDLIIENQPTQSSEQNLTQTKEEQTPSSQQSKNTQIQQTQQQNQNILQNTENTTTTTIESQTKTTSPTEQEQVSELTTATETTKALNNAEDQEE